MTESSRAVQPERHYGPAYRAMIVVGIAMGMVTTIADYSWIMLSKGSEG